MADETYRKYHAGRYPEKQGGPGEASYAEGSKTGYYARDEIGQPIKGSVKQEINKTVDENLEKIFTFEKGTIPRVEEALRRSGV